MFSDLRWLAIFNHWNSYNNDFPVTLWKQSQFVTSPALVIQWWIVSHTYWAELGEQCCFEAGVKALFPKGNKSNICYFWNLPWKF